MLGHDQQKESEVSTTIRSIRRQYLTLVREYRTLGDHSDVRMEVGRLRDRIAALGDGHPDAADLQWEIDQLKGLVAYRRECRTGMLAEILSLKAHLDASRDREAALDGYDDAHEESVLFRRTRHDAGLKRAKKCKRLSDDGDYTITKAGNLRVNGRHYSGKISKLKGKMRRPKLKAGRKARREMLKLEQAAEAARQQQVRDLQLEAIQKLVLIAEADVLDVAALSEALDGQLKPDHPLAAFIGTVSTQPRRRVKIPMA